VGGEVGGNGRTETKNNGQYMQYQSLYEFHRQVSQSAHLSALVSNVGCLNGLES